MIKFSLGVIVVLALVGGAVQFKTTDKEWSLVVNKAVAVTSIKTGAIKIYNKAKQLIIEAGKTENPQNKTSTQPSVTIVPALSAPRQQF